MDEDWEFYQDWSEAAKKRRRDRLSKFHAEHKAELLALGFQEHTGWHFGIMMGEKKLDYWPSANRWHFDGRSHNGDFRSFLGWYKRRLSANV